MLKDDEERTWGELRRKVMPDKKLSLIRGGCEGARRAFWAEGNLQRVCRKRGGKEC